MNGGPQVGVVGDDESGRGRLGPRRSVIDELEQHLVRRAVTAVPDGDAAGNPLAAEAALRRPVEHQRDRDLRWNGRPQPPYDRRRGLARATRTTRERVKQVRPVDEA